MEGASTPRPAGDDDLFAPSLQHHAGTAARRPWRLGSQFWVAFFGGPLAVGAIAWLNAGRLGLPAPRRRAIVALAAGTFLLLAAGMTWALLSLGLDAQRRMLVRRSVQVGSVVLYLALVWLQRPFDRRHQAFDGEYARLWVPGLLAVLGGAVVQFALAAGLAAVVMGLRG